ncbi:MAG: 50S ribosomal protein L32 [Patescibacteria group bacterium]|jgi:large subunit ribosomal protein L32
MPVPSFRRSKSHGRRRRSHDALKRQTLTTCAKCKQPKPQHQVCPSCGTYRGRQIMPAASTKTAKRSIRRTKAVSEKKA